MEQFFRSVGGNFSGEMGRQICLRQVEDDIDQLQTHLQGMNAQQQRQYLERHHRDLLETIGDWARPLNVFSKETDDQAVTRLLNDARGDQIRRCNHR